MMRRIRARELRRYSAFLTALVLSAPAGGLVAGDSMTLTAYRAYDPATGELARKAEALTLTVRLELLD